MTCGPPKDYLNFSSSLSAEWRRDGVLIPADEQHTFSIQNREATLTVSNFYITDNGKEIDKWWSFTNQTYADDSSTV